jgi:hypothetical protein
MLKQAHSGVVAECATALQIKAHLAEGLHEGSQLNSRGLVGIRVKG